MFDSHNARSLTGASGHASVRHQSLVDTNRYAYALVMVLMILHALPYAWATVTLDTARDLSEALRITEGDWVQRGPILNGLFHLGPIWFYLLAPVLAVSKSQAVVLLWVGLLAAVKFPLAYAVGSRMRDSRLGLCFASILALPGWSALGAVFPTHTVMVEAAVLLLMFLMLRLAQNSSSWYWMWLGLAVGLALHAHPTAVLVLMLLPLVIWQRGSRWLGSDIGAMSLGAVLCMVPLLPMLNAEWSQGWPALNPTMAFANESLRTMDPAAPMAILYGAFVEGPRTTFALLGEPTLVWIAIGLLSLIALAAGYGAIRQHDAIARRWILLLLTTLIAMTIALAWIRDYTPFYMTLCLLPSMALALAQGLSALPWGRYVFYLIVLFAIVVSAMLIVSAQLGRAQINVGRLANVQNTQPKMVNAALLPAWQLDALADMQCLTPRPVVLHGYLAVLVDSSLWLGSEIRCAGSRHVSFSGNDFPAAEHWLGLPPSLALDLGLQSGPRWTDTPRQGVQALWPPTALDPADRTRYPHHLASGEQATPRVWRVQSRARSVLITTDLLYPYRVNRVERVLADGKPARKLASANVTMVWMCEHCDSASIAWEVQGLSNDPNVLDIVAVPLPSHSGLRR